MKSGGQNPKRGENQNDMYPTRNRNRVTGNPKLPKAVTRLYLIGISSCLSPEKAYIFLYHSIYI
jgi:hypothetical protein